MWSWEGGRQQGGGLLSYLGIPCDLAIFRMVCNVMVYVMTTTGKPYRIVVSMVKTWIMQRISTALMQGMAACIHERLDNIQRDRHLVL